jgi:hypothetical protein
MVEPSLVIKGIGFFLLFLFGFFGLAMIVNLFLLLLVAELLDFLCHPVFHLELERVRRFLAGGGRVGLVKVGRVILGLVSFLVVVDVLVELKVALCLLVFPKVRETLVIYAQFKSVTVLNHVQRVLSHCERELEGT